MEKKKTTLYNITLDHLALMDEIEEAEGLLTPEMEEALIINEKDLQTKTVGYLEFIKSRERFKADCKDEIKRLQGLVKKDEMLIQILKDRILSAVNIFGEITVGTLKFGRRKSTVLIIENEELIPKEYKIQKVTTSIDRMKIKSDLKTMDIPSAQLQTNYNLSIK